MRPQPPEWLTGKTVAVVGSGPGRPGRRPAADPRRAHRRGLRARRPHRRPAALRHPRVQDGEAAPRPAARPDAARGHASSAPASTSASTSPATQLRERYDAVVLAIGATVAARPAGRRAASSTASTRRWSTCRSPTGPRSARRSTDQITAAGKHVVIIGGGDTGADCLGTAHRQGAASVTQLEIMPRAADDAAGRPAVADVPDDLPGLLARTRRAASGSTPSRPRSSSATRTATSGRCAWSRCEFEGRQVRRGRGHRARDPGRAGAARDGLHRPGAGRRCVEQLGVELDERGNVARDDVVHDHGRRASSSPATPAAASR